jgi:T4-like virus Myoviridae tail sheath stabiliser
MTTANTFFYDGQIRRFISQFIRMVSNFQVEFGKDRNGIISLQRVPVIYGDQSRQAAQIVRSNSENTLNSVPIMAVYVSALQYDRERMQDPTLVQQMNFRERQFDPVTGTYLQNQGDALTVERLMPAPYKLTLKLDIWTSNTEQKFQLIEQLTTLFNPALEIQNTDNYIDWTSLSYALLTDVLWSSRTVPTGGEEPIDIATLTFELPVWISTSVKVKRLGVIQSVINNIQELPSFDSLGLRIVTLLNYGVLLTVDSGIKVLTLIKNEDIVQDDPYSPSVLAPGTTQHAWANLLEEYGTFRSGITQIRLAQENGSEIVGTVAAHPTDPYQLIYNTFVDTVPANTLTAINAIIDPEKVDVDSMLLTPTVNTRYLIVGDIGNTDNIEGAVAWRGSDNQDLVAHANDIIEYNGTHWSVVFDSNTIDTLQYVTNITTGIQYKWLNNQWTKSYEGIYRGGQWGIAI